MGIEATGGSFRPQSSEIRGGQEIQQTGEMAGMGTATLVRDADSLIDQSSLEADYPQQTDASINDFAGMSNEAIAAQVHEEATEDIATEVPSEALDDVAAQIAAQRGTKKGGVKEAEAHEETEKLKEGEEAGDKEDTSGRSGIQAVKKTKDLEEPDDVDAKKQLQKKEEFANFLEKLFNERQASGKQIQPHDYIRLALNGEPPDLEGFKDPTLAYEAIRHVHDKFAGDKAKNETQEQLAASTLGASQLMFEEQGPLIRAGWIFGVKDPGLNDYRNIVLKFDKLPDLFSAVMTRAGGKKEEVNALTDKLTKAIEIDLKAQESTLDPVHLHSIRQDLFKVRICDQVFKECSLLIDNMNEQYGDKTG